MVYTVRVEPEPDEKERYADERTYRGKQLDYAKWLNIISAVGGGIAFIALISLIANAFILQRQLTTMREANINAKAVNDLQYRPYIGVDEVSTMHLYKDSRGNWRDSQNPTPQTDRMVFRATMKNFGPVPGLNYKADWRVFVDGGELPGITDALSTPFKLFPTQSTHLQGAINPPTYKAIMDGERQLTIEVTMEYDYPNGHEKECQKYKYMPGPNGFAMLGACGK
jgi:hypothetical protein